MQYTVLIISIPTLLLMRMNIIMKFLLLLLFTFLGIVLLPYWYKTFFDSQFVGFDRPTFIQWSEEEILFRGFYFKVKIPLKDILNYSVSGIRWFERSYIIIIRIKKPDNSIEYISVPTTMNNKKKLLLFLKEKIG